MATHRRSVPHAPANDSVASFVDAHYGTVFPDELGAILGQLSLIIDGQRSSESHAPQSSHKRRTPEAAKPRRAVISTR